MMLNKITNLTKTEITIEDLSVNLKSGQSIILQALSCEKSNDLKYFQNNKLVSVSFMYQPRPNIIDARKKDTNKIQEEKIEEEIAEKNSLSKKLDDIQKMLFTLMTSIPDQTREIKKQISELPQPAVIPYRPGMVHQHEIDLNTNDSPMYIPSKVIPETTISGLKTSDSEVDKNVDDNLDKLKKMRDQK